MSLAPRFRDFWSAWTQIVAGALALGLAIGGVAAADAAGQLRQMRDNRLASADLPTSKTSDLATITVVSPPNAHLIPLLVALKLHPDLPVKLLPVAGGKDIKPAFENGADVLLAMTYIGAKQRMSGAVPDLQLVLPTTWRGFWEVTAPDVKSFADLKGKTVVVSGPAGAGKDGGGDIIFRAAAKRQGIDSDRDLKVIYAPVSEGQTLLASGKASAIAVPSPASSGFAMKARFDPTTSLVPTIDYQAIFSGFTSFPKGQLPLGGIHASKASLDDPAKRASIDLMIAAYGQAVQLLKEDPQRFSRIAVDQFESYYKSTGAPTPPRMALSAAIETGDLVYRTDLPTKAIEPDLDKWLTELLGQDPGAGFYAK